ncbi:hypothetical protein [Streptomyces sp. B6B3]|uniref:hypothetical protein n=1 Tax=Streptomyces sp. B6B3 TaxID=3153570 RepID=UPI00325F5D32
MSYKVTYLPDARRGIGALTQAQRHAVMAAERGVLATRPNQVGEVIEGRGPNALRRLVLEKARVSIGYRVYEAVVHVEIVWLIGHP